MKAKDTVVPPDMPKADPHRVGRRVFDVLIVLLVPAVLSFAYTTMKKEPGTPAAAAPRVAAAPATTSPPTAASSARAALPVNGAATWLGADGTTLVALTSGDCVAGLTPPGRLLHRAAGAATFAPYSTVPLAEVESVDKLGKSVVHATGLDAQCERVHLVTRDAGRHWLPAAGLDKLGVVDHVGGRVAWGISAAERAQVVRTVDGGTTFTAAAYPCPADLAAPRLVTAVSRDVAWVACAGQQKRGLQARLLYGTVDGGVTWIELAGARRGVPRGGGPDGLDGDGELRSIGFSSARAGWAVVLTPTCGVGELRTTADGGRSWTRMPCLAASGAALDRSFAVTFRDARRGIVVGVRDGAELAYETTDGGRRWRAVGAATS